jgi:hypothetical protein
METPDTSTAQVAVGDVLKVYWPLDGEGDATEKLTVTVVGVKHKSKAKHDHPFEYKLQLEGGEVRKSRLVHLKWKLRREKKRKREEGSELDGCIVADSRPEAGTGQPVLPLLPLGASESQLCRRFSSRLPDFRYILAPMVGASELAFRLLCRRYGASLAYTPMMSAQQFVESAEYREEQFQTIAQDRPLVAHFSANSPETLLQAAKLVEHQCDAIGEFSCIAVHCIVLCCVLPTR